MHASVGDRIHTHGVTGEGGGHVGEIVEVRGAEDGPPYLVRFPDGSERLVYPGPDTVVEPAHRDG